MMIRMTLMVASAFFIWLAADAAQAQSACFNAVQNRIAWNAAGNSSWNPANVRNLCAGAKGSSEPATCFETVMNKRVSHGEGYQWRWKEAIELCRGTLDSKATLACFRQKISQGVSFARARTACQWRIPPTAGRATPSNAAKPANRVGTVGSVGNIRPAVRKPGPTLALRPSVLLARQWQPITFFERNRAGTTGTLRWTTGAAGPFVLSGFRFRFENGDHELQRMALGFSGNGYEYSRIQAAFRDGNGDDPYAVQFRYANINKRAVKAGAQWKGEWQLRSSSAPLSASEKAKLNGACMNGDGMVPLLAGFDFSQSAKDVKVRRLAAICAMEPVKQCLTAFGWRNAGPDGCKAGVQSRNTFRTVYRKSWTDAERFDMDDFTSFFEGRRFYGGKAVKVDRVFVPLTAIDECGFFYARDSHQMESFARGRPVAIQGFDLRFLDTDHNLLEAGVMPQEPGGNQISFRDNSGEDPFEYRVQVCALKQLGDKPAPVASRTPTTPITPSRNYAALRFQNISVNTRNARTSALLPSTLDAQKGALLSSFFLGFENGDHKIKTIGVMPAGNAVQFNYADGNGDDPFTASAKFIKPIGATMPVIPLRSTDEFGAPAYNCNDTATCTWIIGSARGVPNKFIPVLSGFYFDRQATDANIGGLSAGWFARMRGDQGGFQALMSEDGGWNWQQTESQIDREARNTLFRGTVALVPAEKVERCGTVSQRWWGESRPGNTSLYDSVRLLPNKRFVLQRISFGFAEDHNLQHIGVQYRNDGELRVHFKDNNRDDYYWWSIGYCYLKD